MNIKSEKVDYKNCNSIRIIVHNKSKHEAKYKIQEFTIKPDDNKLLGICMECKHATWTTLPPNSKQDLFIRNDWSEPLKNQTGKVEIIYYCREKDNLDVNILFIENQLVNEQVATN